MSLYYLFWCAPFGYFFCCRSNCFAFLTSIHYTLPDFEPTTSQGPLYLYPTISPQKIILNWKRFLKKSIMMNGIFYVFNWRIDKSFFFFFDNLNLIFILPTYIQLLTTKIENKNWKHNFKFNFGICNFPYYHSSFKINKRNYSFKKVKLGSVR